MWVAPKKNDQTEAKKEYLDISDLDPVLVLQQLWAIVKPQGWGFMSGEKELTYETAKNHIDRDDTIWVAGRKIDVYFNDLTNVNVSKFNSAHGEGRAQALIAQLRRNGRPTNSDHEISGLIDSFQSNLGWLKKEAPQLSTEAHIRGAIVQTESDAQFTTTMSPQNEDTFCYLSKKGVIKGINAQSYQPIPFEELQDAFEKGLTVFCERKINHQTPFHKIPVYLCHSFKGAKDCMLEAKELGCLCSFYVAPSFSVSTGNGNEKAYEVSAEKIKNKFTI